MTILGKFSTLFSRYFLHIFSIFDTALSYMNYFYHYQPDLFICAYDDDIPIAAVMSTLKPYYDGLHLTETELFVSEDYRGQNIGKNY